MPTFDEECGISIELKARLGWTVPDRYPRAVLVQHDCCYDHGVSYYPRLTCKIVNEEVVEVQDADQWYGMIDTGLVRYKLSCGHDVFSRNYEEPKYCTECGAIVVD